MKIVLFGATGNAGERIAVEALNRGHDVVGIVRDPAYVPSPDSRMALVRGDAKEPGSVTRVVHGADAIVSAISPRRGESGRPATSLAEAARALTSGARHAGIERLVVMGCVGLLRKAPGQPEMMDMPGFQETLEPEAQAHREALDVYRQAAGDLAWTMLCPPTEIGPGERTGRYRTGEDILLVDESGQSRISYEDYAVALLDELDHPRHVRRCFTVAY